MPAMASVSNLHIQKEVRHTVSNTVQHCTIPYCTCVPSAHYTSRPCVYFLRFLYGVIFFHVPASILASTCKRGSDEVASMSGTLPSNRSEDNDFLGSSDEDTSGPQKGKYNVVFKRGNVFIYLEIMSIVKSNRTDMNMIPTAAVAESLKYNFLNFNFHYMYWTFVRR